MSENSRRHFSPDEKVAILRRHLLEHIPVSQLCEQHGIAPSVFYHWQREFFENGHRAFTGNGKRAHRAEAAQQDKIDRLEAKLRKKDEVLAELMEEHVTLKKSLGET
jgi:transposase-like protein